MDGLTTQIMIKALDGLSERATVTAANIANAGTPNYRPLRLSFERALVNAAARGPDAVHATTPHVARISAGAPDGQLRLDLELATASATALRYSALIELLNRQMQTEALAIKGSD
jgi:flagellar basal-body rod protein FlgB